jgi:hypothetical protein
MITLRLKDSGATLGSISEADLQVLLDQFEEESSTDRDYFIDERTVQIIEEAGASPDLCALLRKAIGGGDGIDIVWSRP